jgi:hypothetical protein
MWTIWRWYREVPALQIREAIPVLARNRSHSDRTQATLERPLRSLLQKDVPRDLQERLPDSCANKSKGELRHELH